MKSLAELNAIRDKMKDKIGLRQDSGDNTRIVVGMATCGIAAGARPVLQAFVEEAAKSGGGKVTVTQTGCIGVCQYEPVVEIFEPGKEKVTYVKVDAARAKEIYERHIKGGSVVTEYTIGANIKG